MLATYSRRLEELFCILDTGIIVQIYYACITISIKRGGMLKTWISNIYCNILSRLESRRYFTILNHLLATASKVARVTLLEGFEEESE